MATKVNRLTATEHPGNTKTGCSKNRAYQFTLHKTEKYPALKQELQKLKSLDYLISCKEVCPTTQKEHIHVYAHFKTPYKLNKKITDIGAHIEFCKGSPKQNIAYIRKDGNVLDEIGEEPKQGMARTVQELREADISEINPVLYKIKKAIDEEEKSKNTFLEMLSEIENDKLKEPKVYYITGDTGKGKTYAAYKLALSMYDKQNIAKLTLNNNFVDITNGDEAKCYVIEEFRPSQIHAANFLQLTDKYGYRCNVKGGFATIRPECLIIASIIPPDQLYFTEEVNEQFLRRITKQFEADKDDFTELDIQINLNNAWKETLKE